jgi:signal transduction histidine kinase/CheY-like chemotaxis protein
MSADPHADPSRPPAVQDSLAQISHTLDELRDRLRHLEGKPGDPLARERQTDEITPIDPAALGGLLETLSLPSSGLAPNEVFSMAMDRLVRLLEADRAMLFLLDPERACLVPTAARGFRRDDLAGVSIGLGEGLVGRAFIEGRPLSYGRPADATPTDPFIARFPIRDGVAVPVRAESQVLGVLYAGRRGRSVPFTLEDVRLLVLVADRIAGAFAQERLADRAASHLATLRELAEFADHAVVGHDLVEVLSRACEVACRLLGTRAALAVLSDPAGEVRVAAASGVGAEALAAGLGERHQGLLGEVLLSGQPLVVPDLPARGGSIEPLLPAMGARGCLVVPLSAHGRIVGALYLVDVRPREFVPDQVATGAMIAALAAMVVENDRLYREVRGALETVSAAQERMVRTERLRALGEMAGGVAHEFNNILAIILGKTQLMLSRNPDDAIRHNLSDVEEAAWRAADVVRRLQGFAATRFEDAPALVDMNTLAHDAITLTRGLWKDEAEARGVRIEVVTHLEETPSVRGSASELREAVTNLVLNALDAMPSGGRLGVVCRPIREGAEVTVTDTGEGMSEDVRRRIFDPFFSTRGPRRSGLGLSLVHGIVIRHDGQIEVSSEPGQGTTVTLWLPGAGPTPIRRELAPAAAVRVAPVAGAPVTSAPTERTPAPAAPEPASEAVAILVLEDEEKIREMLVETLERSGHRVEAAADGLSGLARFQGGQFDVVVTDLSLPERSGLDVARAVKQMRPGTPVILITGWGHLLDPARLAESGVDLTLVKPFRMERVLAVVGDALRLRRAS